MKITIGKFKLEYIEGKIIMKVGILTFHRATNYGAVLQCYALQKVLEQNGYKVEVIDYENDFFKKFYSPFYLEKLTLKKFGYMIYAFKPKMERNKVFANFRNKFLKLSQPYNKTTISNADGMYDAIIVGSDQVWNLEQSQGDNNYLLSFVKLSKRLSYAASFGITELPPDQISLYRKELQQYDRISVREKSGCEIVERLGCKNSSINLDPTLLLEKENWAEVTGSVHHDLGRYICVYKINVSKTYEFAEELSRKTGLKVIVIKPDKTCPVHFIKEKYASPCDFLRLIENAEYVITDSFHGTVFSLIYERQFITCLDKRINNKNTRIIELLESYSLGNRVVDNLDEVESIHSVIDYDIIKETMRANRAESLEYLRMIKEYSKDKE